MLHRIMPKRPQPPKPMDLAQRQISEIKKLVGPNGLSQKEADGLIRGILNKVIIAESRHVTNEQAKKIGKIVDRTMKRVLPINTR